MYSFFSKNGKILPVSEAVIPIANIEYAYGFGVYENIRVKNNRPFFLNDHLERLSISAQTIGLRHQFTRLDITKFCEDLIAKIAGVSPVTLNLKILLIGASQPEDAQLFILPLAPLFPDKKMYREGVKVSTVPYERNFPQAKTLNMLGSYLAFREAKEKNCYDALLLDKAGCVREGTRTNFFVIKGRDIFEPPVADILPGVTRKYVLQVAQKNGSRIVEQPIPLDSFKDYDAAFLTSTSSKIVPIKQINDFVFPDIPSELARLLKLFNDFLDTV